MKRMRCFLGPALSLVIGVVACAGCGGSEAIKPPRPIDPYRQFFVSERTDSTYLFATLHDKSRFESSPRGMEFKPFVALGGRPVNVHIPGPDSTKPTTIPAVGEDDVPIEIASLVNRIARGYEIETGVDLVAAEDAGSATRQLLEENASRFGTEPAQSPQPRRSTTRPSTFPVRR